MKRITNYFYIFSKIITSLVLLFIVIAMGFALFKSYRNTDSEIVKLDSRFKNLSDSILENNTNFSNIKNKTDDIYGQILEIKNNLSDSKDKINEAKHNKDFDSLIKLIENLINNKIVKINKVILHYSKQIKNKNENI